MCFVYYTQKDKDEVFTTYQQVSPQKLTLNLRPGKKKNHEYWSYSITTWQYGGECAFVRERNNQ